METQFLHESMTHIVVLTSSVESETKEENDKNAMQGRGVLSQQAEKPLVSHGLS